MSNLGDSFNPKPKPEKREKKAKKPLKRAKVKKKPEVDAELWKWFSIYIRLRDVTIDGGYGRCFTCKKIIHWREGDCGHGVGRQHWGTKYNEKNNALQCKKCNGFEAGRQDLYAIEMDKRDGPGSWDLMNARMNGKKISAIEAKLSAKFYENESIKLAKQKGQTI